MVRMYCDMATARHGDAPADFLAIQPGWSGLEWVGVGLGSGVHATDRFDRPVGYCALALMRVDPGG